MMKKISALAILSLLVIAPLCAQQAYKHSVGVTVGSFDGLSYKCFPTSNPKLALQCDLGISMLQTPTTTDIYVSNQPKSSFRDTESMWTFKVNPQLLYQTIIDEWDWGGMSWYVGGGLSVGTNCGGFYDSQYYNNFLCGVNGAAGVELGLDDAPLTISFDFRPGYGCYVGKTANILDPFTAPARTKEPVLYATHATSFFDWAIAVGIRYTL